MKTLLQRAEALCRERGARLTPQRAEVLRLICEAERPLGAYDLLERMARDGRRPAPPTVYRALEFLMAQGLIHRLESLHAYVGCRVPGQPHCGQFLICTDCGRVSELCETPIEQGLRAAERATGFRTRRPVIELLGTCADCRHA